MPTIEELRSFQKLPLDIKIRLTEDRINEYVRVFGIDNVCISFSGGKDSTVVLDIARKTYPNIKAVYCDTGLEYPEIKQFVKSFSNVEIIRPKMVFADVIKEYGYPIISKDISNTLFAQRYSKTQNTIRMKKLLGEGEFGGDSRYNYSKWLPLLDVDFKIGDSCCSIMKKNPLKDYQKKTKQKPIVCTMADESMLRTQRWLKDGCTIWEGRNTSCKPISFWTNQDILQYIKENNLPIASVYGEIVETIDGNAEQMCIEGCGNKLKCTGCQRTGCMYCGYGAHLEKQGEKRFVKLKQTHPKIYDFVMNGGEHNEQGLWQPTKEGLGFKYVLDTLNKIYGKDFIEY